MYLAYHSVFFFFNDAATTEIYSLSLHDALPISCAGPSCVCCHGSWSVSRISTIRRSEEHTAELQSPYVISYAVFCLQKQHNNSLSTFSARPAHRTCVFQYTVLR